MIFWILAIWIVTCVIPVFKMFSNIRGTSGIQAIYSFGVIVIIYYPLLYTGQHITS